MRRAHGGDRFLHRIVAVRPSPIAQVTEPARMFADCAIPGTDITSGRRDAAPPGNRPDDGAWREWFEMNKDDAAYYYRRAELELELAQAAEHPAAVKAHYLLASHYLDSLHESGAELAPAETTGG
jgi:hypothetical protein